MLPLSSLPSYIQELLEAIGYLDSPMFCKGDVEEIFEEMQRANALLEITTESFSVEDVLSWQEQLTIKDTSTQKPEVTSSAQTKTTQPIYQKGDIKSSHSFETSTTKQKKIKKTRLPASQKAQAEKTQKKQYLLPGKKITGITSQLEDSLAKKPERRGALPLSPAKPEKELPLEQCPQALDLASHLLSKRKIAVEDISKGFLIREEKTSTPSTKQAVKKPIKSPQLSLRQRIKGRGIPHSQASRMRLAAWSTVCFFACLFLLFFIIPITVFFHFGLPQPVTTLVLLALSFMGLLVFGTLAAQGRCCVCRQRQFLPKNCLKHTKAHRFPLLGHILPTALHAIIFGWFYCIYCGTAVQIKKEKKK